MKSVVLYAHGGSGNHGCEALVRTTVSLLKEVNSCISVISSRPEEDALYIKDLPVRFLNKGKTLNSFQKIPARLFLQLTGSYKLYDSIEMHSVVHDIKNSLCFSIGGDNYCYSDYLTYCKMNSYLIKHNNKTVLWGVSIEPDLLKKQEIIQDLQNYSLITARESITYEALKNAGLTNIDYCPDTAFLLPLQKTTLPSIFTSDVVGVNISPLIMSYTHDSNLVFRNYINLIKFILKETTWNVALIPHVIWDFNDDLIPLKELYNEFQNTGRVALIDENKKLNCQNLKYIISKCKFMVTARTHASIAAYSTGVPTLVTGYSVKAKGIAKDLFGTYEHYVTPVQDVRTEYDLLNDFRLLINNENEIHDILCVSVKKYISIYENTVSRILDL